MLYHLISAAGFLGLAGIAWLLSTNRAAVPWRTVIWGLGLQLVIGLLVFLAPGTHHAFLWLNDAVLSLLAVSRRGTAFLLGPLAAGPGEPGSIGFVLLFQVLPVAIFFAAFTALLHHLRVLPRVVRLFARLFHRTLGISGAEALCGASNIFVGAESALTIRPYLARMTRSELHLILAVCMATVASSTLGIYVSFLSDTFPQIAGHLLSASLLSIPATVVTAKLLVPETDTPETMGRIPDEDPEGRPRNAMGAIIQGAMDGLKLAAGISAMLIAVLGLVGLLDELLALPSAWLGLDQPLSLVGILGWLFHPIAALLGIPAGDIPEAARLLGERLILTEVVAYQDLAQLAAAGQLQDPRTLVILSYALCGFAHVASVAIFVGGLAALVPARRDDLAALGPRALLAATLATLMTGCVAGMFASGQGILIVPGGP